METPERIGSYIGAVTKSVCNLNHDSKSTYG